MDPERFKRCLALLQYHEDKTATLPYKQLGPRRIFESKIVLVISNNEGFAFSQDFGLIYINKIRCFLNDEIVKSVSDVGKNVKVTLTRSNFPIHFQGYLVGKSSEEINLKLDSFFKYKAIKCWPTGQSKPNMNVSETRPQNKPSLWMKEAFSEQKFLLFLERLTVSPDDFESMVLAYTKMTSLPTLREIRKGLPTHGHQPNQIYGGLPDQPVKTTTFQPIVTSAKDAVSKYGLFPNYHDVRQSISKAEEIRRLGFDLDELAPIVDLSDGIGVMNLA